MQLSGWVQKEADEQGSEERTAAMAYWLDQFKGTPPVLELPTDRPRPAIKTYRAQRENLDLDAVFTKQIRELATRNGATTFATLLAAFQSFLHRLSGQSDIVVGFSLAGQSNIEGRDLVGHCVNFLPLRASIKGDSKFSDQVAQARGKALDAVEHQQFAFGNLIQRLNLRRDPSRVPLMSVAFNLDPSSRASPLVTSRSSRGQSRAATRTSIFSSMWSSWDIACRSSALTTRTCRTARLSRGGSASTSSS